MLERLSNIWLFLMTPQNAFEYLWKLVVLCVLTTSVAIILEFIMGTPVSNPIETYFMIVFIVSSPFFSFCMHQTTKMIRLQDELARMAATDILTGLNNRRSFFELVKETQAGHVVMLDIDHFKRINDTFGHDAGDKVLVSVADYIRTAVENLGVAARFGGEEFAIYLETEDSEAAKSIANHLVSGVTVSEADTNLAVTLSAGVADIAPQSTITQVLKRADEALYAAKAAGRACVKPWTPELSRSAS